MQQQQATKIKSFSFRAAAIIATAALLPFCLSRSAEDVADAPGESPAVAATESPTEKNLDSKTAEKSPVGRWQVEGGQEEFDGRKDSQPWGGAPADEMNVPTAGPEPEPSMDIDSEDSDDASTAFKPSAKPYDDSGYGSYGNRGSYDQGTSGYDWNPNSRARSATRTPGKPMPPSKSKKGVLGKLSKRSKSTGGAAGAVAAVSNLQAARAPSSGSGFRVSGLVDKSKSTSALNGHGKAATAQPKTGGLGRAIADKSIKQKNSERRLQPVEKTEAEPTFFDSVDIMAREKQQRRAPAMRFTDYGVNPTIASANENTSTFAVDVDTGSYQMARSHLNRSMMPPESSIRVEEMINAFDYAYTSPKNDAFAVQAEAFPSPNRKGYHVLHIGLKGKEISKEQRKAANLVFVVDVSGSMSGSNRLGLVKRSLNILTQNLDGRDSVGIVIYGSSSRIVLSPTRATYSGKNTIKAAVNSLRSEGATNVQAGLELGYSVANRGFIQGGINRVILCSDGVANTGSTQAKNILRRVRNSVNRGVTISTVGFGMGNYNDTLMEQIANKGNGNYAYVDNLKAARKIFEDQLSGTLQIIAKDVKIQMVFHGAAVERYRLIGFENRKLHKRDFANDTVDAGEIGAGHTVTAMYEVKLKNSFTSVGSLGKLRLRSKAPQGHRSQLIERALPASIVRANYSNATAPTRLSFVVGAFAEKLRGSYWVRNLSYQQLLSLWHQIPQGLRHRGDVQELRSLILRAQSLDTRNDRYERIMPVAMMNFDRLPVLR